MTSIEVPYSIAAALPTLSVMDITNEVSKAVATSGKRGGIAYVTARDALSLIRVQEFLSRNHDLVGGDAMANVVKQVNDAVSQVRQHVTAQGATLREASERAYRAVDKIHFPGMQFRRDIGAPWG